MKQLILTSIAFLNLANAPALAATIHGTTTYIPPDESTPVVLQTHVYLDGPVQRDQVTGYDGVFHFSSLPAGTYHLEAFPVVPPPGTNNLSGDCDVPVNVSDNVVCDILLTSH